MEMHWKKEIECIRVSLTVGLNLFFPVLPVCEYKRVFHDLQIGLLEMLFVNNVLT